MYIAVFIYITRDSIQLFMQKSTAFSSYVKDMKCISVNFTYIPTSLGYHRDHAQYN